MIRINLLPSKRKKKSKPLPMYLIYSGVALIASLAVFFFVNSYMNSRIGALEAEKAEKTAKLKKLDEQIKSVKDFENKKAELEKRVRIILEIAQKKSLPAKFLSELSIRLDDIKGVWITSMKFAGKTITLSGVAFNNNDAVNFRNMLHNNPPESPVKFTQVKLPGTQKVSLKGNTVYNFSMTFDVELMSEQQGGANGP